MKKLLPLILALVMLFAMTVSVSAATYSQDGIEIELVTDKAEYAKGETITATVKVTNTNNYAVTDVSLESIVPEGYQVQDRSVLTIATLDAGASATLQIVMAPAASGIWIIVLVAVLVVLAAVAAYFFVFRGKMKRVTAAILCFAMLLTLIPANAIHALADEFVGEEDVFSPDSGTTEPSETVDFSDDFSNFQPVVSDSAPADAGWWITNPSYAVQTGDAQLKVSNLTYHVPEGITEDFTVEFKYQLPSDVSARVAVGKGIDESEAQAYLQFTGGGSTHADRVRLYNIDAEGTDTSFIYGGTALWHTVQIVVSNSTKTYKMYVDGKYVYIGTNTEFAFYNDITETTQVVFKCDSGNLLLDDFKVYLGEPEIDGGLVIEDPCDYTDDFSNFQPAVSDSAPADACWWITNPSYAAQTGDAQLKVSNLTYHVPEGITEDFTVEFRYQLPSDVSARVAVGKGIDTSEAQVYLQFTGGGSTYDDRVKLYKIDAEGTDTSFIYGGTALWHTVQIVVSNSTKTYKMYVDGKHIYSGTTTEFAFYNDITETTQVVFKCDSGRLLLDDFKVYLGEPEIDGGLVIEDPCDYTDDFSNFQPAVSDSTPADACWWITNPSYAVQTGDAQLKVSNLTYYVPEGITEDFTVEFRYQLPSDVSARVAVGKGIDTSEAQVYLQFTGGGSTYDDRVKLYKIDAEGTDTSFIYGGTALWHTVQIVVNNSTKTYKMYVDSKHIYSGTTTDFTFYNDITETTQVVFKCDSGKLLLDDFKVYLGEPDNDGGLVIEVPYNYSDDFSSFWPAVSDSAPADACWWITNPSYAAQTGDDQLKVSNLTYYVPEGITEDFTIEFKYQLPSEASATVAVGNGIDVSEAQAHMKFTGGGGSSIYDDRVRLNQIDAEGTYTSYIYGGIAQWHTVQIVVNNSTKTYKLYVDGLTLHYNGNNEFAFCNDITETTQVVFDCDKGNLLLDDFKVYLGEPEIDEGDVIEDPRNYTDDFSTFQPNVVPSTPFKAGWWLTSETAATLTEDGNVMVTDLRYSVATGITENYTVEFKYQLPANTAAQLMMGETSEPTKRQVYLRINGGDEKSNDRVAYYNGAGSFKTKVFSGTGEWHTMKIAVDVTNEVYYLFLDGVIVADDYRIYASGIDTMNVMYLQCSDGTMLIDDFKITKGLPYLGLDYTPDPNSNLIYEATFDNWDLGKVADGKYRRWSFNYNADEGRTVSVVEVDGKKALCFTQNEDANYPTVTYKMQKAITSGQYTVEIKYKQPVAVDAMLSLHSPAGGFANAGPDLRFHINEMYTVTNNYHLGSGIADDEGWRVVAICFDMDTRTYDVYSNGVLMEEGIPFRNTNIDTINSVILGHAWKGPGTTYVDYLRIYKGKVNTYASLLKGDALDGFEKKEAEVVNNRESFDRNYSDVILSTRRVRGDGYSGHYGSLDILKQFMVTYDVWMYLSSPDITKKVTDMGIDAQMSMSPNNVSVSGKDTDCKFYDGTEAYLPWLPASTSNFGCLNNPDAVAYILNTLKTAVEGGARSIQNDDPLYNWRIYTEGGCFCRYCVQKFPTFLLENYTAEELAKKAPGVTIDKNFNYREYLKKTYGWTTNDQYKANRTQCPLEEYYEDFMIYTTVKHHEYVKEYLNNLGYGEIGYSANFEAAAFNYSYVERENAMYYLFDASMPETGVTTLDKDFMVSAAYVDSAFDRNTIFSVTPRTTPAGLRMLRIASARAYALGIHTIIPWDTYNGDPARAWSSVEEVGDIYHFVRQYPYLFDDYETKATVGVVMNFDRLPDNLERQKIIMNMFNAGIPFKILAYSGRGEYTGVTFDESDLEGLDYIWEASAASTLPEELQGYLDNCGAEKIKLYPLLDMKESLRLAWVENDNDQVYTTVRSLNGELGTAASVHVINDAGDTIKDTVVGLSRAGLPEGNYTVTLYRPGYDPVILEGTAESTEATATLTENIQINGDKFKLEVNVSYTVANSVKYTVPEMKEWSVLHIVPEGTTEGVGQFDVSDGWSGISLGTGVAVGDAITQNGEDSFTLTTSYLGANVRTATDPTGSQDMMLFAYKNIRYSKLTDYSVEGKVSATSNSGIMIREYASSNARQISLYVENGKLIAAARLTDNKAMLYRELMDVTQDMYLKITKNGGEFEFYASTDGENWGDKLISAAMTMDMPLAGLFAFSGDGQSATATVTDVKITEIGINGNMEIGDATITVDKTYYLGEADNKLSMTCTGNGLTLTDVDFEKVVYSSSDMSVMYVNENNVVVGVKDGVATLTVTATAGNYTVTGQVDIEVRSGGRVIIDEDFDLWTPETADPQWSISPSLTSSNNTYVFTAPFPDDTNKSMGIMDFSYFQAVVFYDLDEPETENHTIEFDYYIETERETVGNLNTIYISSPLGFMSCLFYEGNKFRFYDNTLWHDIATIDPNQWVHIKVDINFDDQTNTYTITDAAGTTTTATFELRNSGVSTTQLRFTTNTAAQGMTVYYDNLKMYLTGK